MKPNCVQLLQSTETIWSHWEISGGRFVIFATIGQCKRCRRTQVIARILKKTGGLHGGERLKLLVASVGVALVSHHFKAEVFYFN